MGTIAPISEISSCNITASDDLTVTPMGELRYAKKALSV